MSLSTAIRDHDAIESHICENFHYSWGWLDSTQLLEVFMGYTGFGPIIGLLLPVGLSPQYKH